MNFIKYLIYIFKNKRLIQKINWEIWAHERTSDIHLKEIYRRLWTNVDILKFNYLAHKDCFNDESITISKRDIVIILDNIQSLITIQEEAMWDKKLIYEYRKYLYK